jgi:hypothetical protein
VSLALAMNPRAEQFGAMEIDLRDITFTRELLALIPAVFARQHLILPVLYSPDRVVVAMADPSDLGAIDALHARLQRVVEIAVADESQLREFTGRLYGSEGAQ